jgi:GT2 family glycosyltransferase
LTASRFDPPVNFSIVIVNFNGARFIKDCLDSVLNTNYPNFEVIVVDNNSTDESIIVLERFKDNPRLKTVFLDRNLHFAGGNNVGINCSRGKYLVFLNPDTTVSPSWLIELNKSFDLDENISAVQCLLLRSDGEEIDTIGGTIDYCARPVSIVRLWTLNKEAKKELRLFYGCGAALAIRRDVLKKIGFFDSDLKTDEIDICWRINLNGGHIVLGTRAIVYHSRSGAFGNSLSKERIFFGDVAALSSILKNYELRTIITVFPYLVSFAIVAVANDLLVRHRLDIIPFRLKAYVYVLRNLREIFKKRSQVQKYVRSVPDAEICKLMIRPNFSYYLVPDVAFCKLVKQSTCSIN